MKVTIDGITITGETDDEKFWAFSYENGTPAMDLWKRTDEVGDVEYEYIWKEYPSEKQYVSENMFAGTPATTKDIVEWICAVYPNYENYRGIYTLFRKYKKYYY